MLKPSSFHFIHCNFFHKLYRYVIFIFLFFFLNKTYQAFLLFLLPASLLKRKTKLSLKKMLLKRDYTRLEYSMVLLLQQLTGFRLLTSIRLLVEMYPENNRQGAKQTNNKLVSLPLTVYILSPRCTNRSKYLFEKQSHGTNSTSKFY